jgi:hypothetical protein
MNIRNVLINGLVFVISLEAAGNAVYAYMNRSFFYADKIDSLFSAPSKDSHSGIEGLDADRLWKERQVIHPYFGFVDDLTYLEEVGEAKFRTKLGFLKAAGQSQDFPFYDENHTNVAIFGGSVATGICLAFPIIAESLRRVPSLAETQIEPFCYALGGKKQPDQLQALSYLYALGAHFDIVINLDGFNEVAIPIVENYAKGVNPFFPRSWHLQAAPSDVGRTLSFLSYVKDISRRAANSSYNWSALVTSTADAVVRMVDKTTSNVITGYFRESGNYPFAQSGPTLVFDSDESQWRELARMWARSSVLMGKLVKEMGGQYFHFLQPNQYYGFKEFTPQEQANAFSHDHPYRQGAVKGYPQLVKFNRFLKKTVNYRDLTKVFADVEETLYIDSCCHTNSKGNRIMATAIAQTIREKWNDGGAVRDESYRSSGLYRHEYSYR